MAFGGSRDVAVIQISRGLAPARCIAEAYQAAWTRSVGYLLIAGMPAVDAKNEAIDRCLYTKRDLLLIEDDVLASREAWNLAFGYHGTAAYADALCRDGRLNTVRSLTCSGRFLYTGTCFCRLSLELLLSLQQAGGFPLQAWEYQTINDVLVPVAPDPYGRGSDVWLWDHVRRVTSADFEPACLGRVSIVESELNANTRHDLVSPSALTIR